MFKMKPLLILTIALSACIQVRGEEEKVKYLFNEAFFNFGGFISANRTVNLQDFKTLAPSSPILQRDFSQFRNSNYDWSLSQSTPYFLMGIGLKKSNSKGPVIRLGIGYGASVWMNGGYFKEDIHHIDTLVSQSSGRTAYIDSVYHDTYRFNYKADMLALDASAVWYSDQKHKFSVYGGFGVWVGTSLSSTTEITHTTYSYINGNTPNYYGYHYGSGNTTESESYKNKAVVNAAAYIPFGMDLRLANNHSFWQRLHLFHESRFRVQYQSIANLNKGASANYHLAFGIRYVFAR
jgi:hypothetical protein